MLGVAGPGSVPRSAGRKPPKSRRSGSSEVPSSHTRIPPALNHRSCSGCQEHTVNPSRGRGNPQTSPKGPRGASPEARGALGWLNTMAAVLQHVAGCPVVPHSRQLLDRHTLVSVTVRKNQRALWASADTARGASRSLPGKAERRPRPVLTRGLVRGVFIGAVQQASGWYWGAPGLTAPRFLLHRRGGEGPS